MFIGSSDGCGYLICGDRADAEMMVADTSFIFAGTGGDGCDGLHPCSSLVTTQTATVSHVAPGSK